MTKREKLYWKFARRRLARYYDRLGKLDLVSPDERLAKDPVLDKYRFTNAYRASDRVSQKLIEVQYDPNLKQTQKEVVFRTLLFKFFNKLETWQLIVDNVEPVSKNLKHIRKFLRDKSGLYSAAYIIPSPSGAGVPKAEAHMMLLDELMDQSLPKFIDRTISLHQLYELLLTVRSFGPFLAFQAAIDLNYSSFINYDEASFVVPGPGALDGVEKIFPGEDPTDVIYRMVNHASEGMRGMTLFGRKLQPIDCQNLFCEISKYTRIAKPKWQGTAGRTTIKQEYRPRSEDMPEPFFPPKWKLRY